MEELIQKCVYIKSSPYDLAYKSQQKMSEQQTKRQVVMTSDSYQATFTLNCQKEPHILQIKCRDLLSLTEWQGNFTLSNLDHHYQVIFDNIDSLYHYISEKEQEVQIEGKQVKVQLNFLKQSKVISLELSEIMKCSADQIQRLRSLEKENQRLKVMIKMGGSCNGYQKLTLPHNIEFLCLDSYRLSNCRVITPLPNAYLRTLFKPHHSLTLPSKGIWTFQIMVTSLIIDSRAKSSPLVELGLRNEQGETIVTSLKSRLEPCAYSYVENDSKEQAQQEGFLQEKDCIRIVLNIDARKMAIIRNFGESQTKMMSWESLKGCQLWLWMRLYMLEIKTDLFVEEQPIEWVEGRQSK